MLIKQQRITRAVGFQGCQIDRQDRFQRRFRAFARDIKLAHVGNVEQAGMLTIPALSEHVQKAYVESFETEARSMPFAEVMIGKLIIE